MAALAASVFSFSACADDDEEDELTSLSAPSVTTDGVTTQKGSVDDEGKWMLPDDSPTYNITIKDNQIVVDWYTYNGFRRYHDACHVCHGPDAEGSTYAPALKDSLKTMSYDDVLAVISGGRVRTLADGSKSVMPEFGANPNVSCYLDDIYVYLKARADGALPRVKLGGRNRVAKPQAARDFDKECFGE